ncbi:MAG: TPM domain-containing protein [Muribaculaceae bacterium]|nr:TPM domain-containing protein [Muribaculaceae bacterium]
MKNKITSFIVLAMLLFVALPACGESSTPPLHQEKEKQMPAAVVGDNGNVTAIPDKPTEKKLLWDLAGVIDPATAQEIEDSLETFSRTTSNQILVMTVTSIGGADISEYATQLGRDWGVGHEGDNNGVVILIKVKTESEGGNVFIATGYGVEAVLPDVLCKRIIEKEMVPHFKEDDYAGGIKDALAVIMPAMKGEFNKEEYMDDTGDAILGLIVMIAIICFIVVAMKKGGMGTGTGTNTRTYTGGPIIFPGGYSGRSSGGSSWGGGSSSGGWGGFGGGSFGGGGAGGSW